MADTTLSRLVRTMSSYFRIGAIRIKDNTGVVQLRDAADSVYADVAAKQVRVQGTNATNAIVLNSPGSLSGTVTLTLPSAVGSTNQVLADVGGDGTLGFISVTSNADLTQVEAFTEATTSPLTIFTPPANAIITKVQIEVTVAAGGGSPTVAVGTSGTPTLYMLTTESDLKTTGIYEVEPMADTTGSPSAVILTIVVSSQTFTGNVYVTYTNPS